MIMNTRAPVVLITGASRGLGLAIARLYARRGAGLILTARGAAALATAADELRHATDVIALPGDVADLAHAAEMVRQGLAHFGRIDVLINNASVIGPSPMPELADYPLEALDEVFRVNVLAPLHLIQLALPGMRERGTGVIVNLSSDAGVAAYPGWGGYGASKAALDQISRVLAAELEGTGLRVFSIDPGDMDTAMHRAAEPGVDLSDLPRPDQVAPAVLRIIAEETAPSGRFQAQTLTAAAVGGDCHHECDAHPTGA